MPVRIEPGREPIPGYKLIERLGGGGFGEVWKAEAPGGLFKAIKFVFGDLQAIDDPDGSRAEQELKALSRVKTVHHPYILSLERYDIIDGQLVIVMELADRTLWDRYRECRTQNLPGVPRDELLGYMDECAEALDLMNIQFQLQHLDIKPQNLFLMFNHIKVADFGLVKDLGNMGAATITGGVTPVYAAPETFDGWLSRYSDQYSLAIVFQEILTGIRPFSGNTMRQLVLQHLQSQPDLSPLPEDDRPAVARALSKNPDERFPTCKEFVQALRHSTPAVAPRHSPPPIPRPSLRAESAPPSLEHADNDKTLSARRMVATPNPLGDPQHTALARDAADVPSGLCLPTPSKLPPRPTGEWIRAGSETSAPRAEAFSADASQEDAGHQGIVQPSLIIGLGHMGLETLRQVRRVLSQEFGHADAVPHIRLLSITSDGDAIRSGTIGENRAALRPHEVMLTRLQRANYYLAKAREGKLPAEGWLNHKVLYRIPRDNTRPQLRPLGRLAFVSNFQVISKRVEAELQACCSDDTLHEMTKHTDLGIRTQVPRVYVVASLCGTTGSGMFLDMAYLVRSRLRKMNFEKAEIVGLFFVPAVAPEGIRSLALANAHAALAELGHFIRKDGFEARYESLESKDVATLKESGPPFQRCFFLTFKTSTTPVEDQATPEAIAQVGQLLYRELTTSFGKAIDASRRDRVEQLMIRNAKPSTMIGVFGLHRLTWPRRDIQQRLAERFCAKLVDRWRTKDSNHLSKEIEIWVADQWDKLQMRPEALIERHQEACQQALQKTPDKVFQETVAPIVAAFQSAKGPAALGSAVESIEKLDKLLGIPELCRDTTHRNMEPSGVEKTLLEVSAALADECDQKLAELVVNLIEAPRYRLAGAEEALRKLSNVVEAALKVQEGLAKELNERAAALYIRLHDLLGRVDRKVDVNTTPSPTQWFGRKQTGPAAGDVAELLRIYPKAQFQALLLHCVSRLYISLRGHLSDQLREVGFCRARLDELAALFREKKETSSAFRFEKPLLPPGCDRLDDVLQAMEDQITEDDRFALDEQVQGFIRKNYKALLNVCLGASSVVRALAPAMLHEAESYLDQRFPPPSVVDLLVARQGADDEPSSLEGAVERMVEAASPAVPAGGADRQFTLIAVPGDDSGTPLAEAVATARPDVITVPSQRCEEVVVYHEALLRDLSDLEQMGPVAHEAYRQRLSQDPACLHTRQDVGDWNRAMQPVS